jgi:hypothetical protein
MRRFHFFCHIGIDTQRDLEYSLRGLAPAPVDILLKKKCPAARQRHSACGPNLSNSPGNFREERGKAQYSYECFQAQFAKPTPSSLELKFGSMEWPYQLKCSPRYRQIRYRECRVLFDSAEDVQSAYPPFLTTLIKFHQGIKIARARKRTTTPITASSNGSRLLERFLIAYSTSRS